MNLERHDGHATPRIFVANGDPMFVAVCAPHEERGPWGEFRPYVPKTPAEREAELIVHAAQAQAGADAPDADDDQAGEFAATRHDWNLDARSGLAVAALRLLEPTLSDVRFDVELCARAESLRPALSAYERPDELWTVIDDEDRAVVSTRSLAAVAYLTGLDVARAACPYVTVAVRAKGFAAALYFDADEDRFYVGERGDAVVQAALEAARRVGFEDPAVADEDVWVMSGTHDYIASLKRWAESGGGGLPF